MFRIFLCALGAGLLLSVPAPASPGSPGAPFIRRFTPEEIGSAPQFFGLAVSADGLLYASGQGGLLEFDGQTWRILTAGQGYLAGNLSDDQGRIYVGGIAKILRLEPNAAGGWTPRDVIAPLGLSPVGSSPFFYAQQDPLDRSLWFSAINRLVRVDANGQASVVREGAFTRLIPWAGRLLLRASGNQVSLGWANAGKIELLEPDAAEALEGVITAVAGSATETLALRPREFRRFTGLRPVEGWRPIPTVDRDNVVLCALKLDDERVVLGTQRGTAIVLSDSGELIETWTEADGLTGGGIRAMRRDGQGGLWLATDSGLARVQIDSQERHISPDRGLRPPVLAIHRHLGRLWAGTAAGAWRQNDDGIFERQPSLPAAVWGFCSDGNDLILAGRTLAVLHPNGANTRLPVPDGFAALGHPEIDPGGQILVVPTSGAVLQYRRGDEYWVPGPKIPGLSGSAFDLQFAPDGALWVADSRTRVLRLPWKKGEGPAGLPLDIPLPEQRSADPEDLRFGVWREQLWLVSNAGLHRWNPAAGELQRAEELGPFARGRLTSIATASDGTLWAFSTMGSDPSHSNRAWRVIADLAGSRRSIEVTEYSTALVMPKTAYGIYADDREHLFTYGEGPVGVVDADGIRGPVRIPPPVRIRRLQTGKGNAFEGGARDFNLPIQLPLGERAVTLEFATPWFPTNSLGQSSLTFRSRLLGDHETWSPWSHDRKRSFTNLPPGTYRFEAQASLTRSAGTAPIGALTFVVLPYWWETLTARLSFALAGIALVAAVVRLLAQQRLRRKVVVLERAARIENERLRIARDMHDDLGSSLAHIAVNAQRLRSEATSTRVEEIAEHIRQSAVEVMSSARDIIWSVNPQSDTLDALSDYLSNWVHRTLGDAGIECRLDVQHDLPDCVVFGPVRNSLLLATKEATHNLVKHAQARSALYRIRLEAEVVTFTLSDEGRGLADRPKSAPGGGMGLSSMLARLQSIGGSATIKGLESGGTAVTFRLPLIRRGGKLRAGG